jgi:3-hydroxyacyl-[acyl-carrier-protein] dehydratase
MTTFQHHFDRVEDYLHHREPYLLVDRIVDLHETQVVTQTTVPTNAFYITGHFPGAPVMPGAMMQEMTTQSAGILIAAFHNPMSEYNTHDPDFNEFALGVLVRVKNARYRGFVQPGKTLQTQVTLREQVNMMFEFRGEVSLDNRVIMRNTFQLTNLPTSQLRAS